MYKRTQSSPVDSSSLFHRVSSVTAQETSAFNAALWGLRDPAITVFDPLDQRLTLVILLRAAWSTH